MRFGKDKLISILRITGTVTIVVLCFFLVISFYANKTNEAIAQACIIIPQIGNPAHGITRGSTSGGGCRTDTRGDSTCSVFMTGTIRCKTHEYVCGIQNSSPDCDKTKGNCQNVRPICCDSRP